MDDVLAEYSRHFENLELNIGWKSKILESLRSIEDRLQSGQFCGENAAQVKRVVNDMIIFNSLTPVKITHIGPNEMQRESIEITSLKYMGEVLARMAKLVKGDLKQCSKFSHLDPEIYANASIPEKMEALNLSNLDETTREFLKIIRTEAERLLDQIRSRLMECKLELHPDKTKIVYCKDDKRNGEYQNTKFDFLGYTFKMRDAKSKKGNLFRSFLPAISDKAVQKIKEKIKEWKIHSRTERALSETANICNSTIRGWKTYYGKFYKSALDEVLKCIDKRLGRWASKKYNKFKSSNKKATKWILSIKLRDKNYLHIGDVFK
ncbi:MAG: hypothetical protein H0W50_01415 [Parachlamydiaceae bacterium]|nr:hypothetical protein [Parachlamydiaceae bacterium]